MFEQPRPRLRGANLPLRSVDDTCHDVRRDLGELVADHTSEITAFAADTARTQHDRRLVAVPAIPWIETGYGIGDQLSKIRGREIDFGTRVGHDLRYPAVIGVIYRLKDRYETELEIEEAR